MYLLKKLILSALVPVSMTAGQLVFMPQNDFQPLKGQGLSFPVNISSLFDNRGFGKEPNESNFDGLGSKLRPKAFHPSSK
jgi:hypothetical protein